MFQHLLATIQHDVAHTIYRVGIRKEVVPGTARRMAALASGGAGGGKQEPAKAAGKKVGRNDPCPCGSGKKYKKCCGK
jgi:preprotein translocase subunit SecA